jgi:PAS domain S-box-containing protein
VASERLDELGGAGLATLVRQLPDAVALVDASGAVLLSHREEELPIPPPSVHGGDAFTIFHPDGRPFETEDWPLLRSSRAGEVIVDEELLRVAPDGSRRSFTCRSAPIYDQNGQIVAAVLVARDITEQKSAQERLAYLRVMLAHTDDAIVAVDSAGRTTVWSRGAERIYGWGAEAVIDRQMPSSLRMGRDERRAGIRGEMSKRGRWRGEMSVGRRDGSAIWVDATNVAIRDARGEVTGHLGIHRDIAERERTTDALREAQRRIQNILTSISDSFIALDAAWRYTYLNQRALELIARGPGQAMALDDFVGESIWEASPQLVGTVIDAEFHRAVLQGKPARFETYLAPTDLWLELHAYPTEDGGLAAYGHDITERKRAEQRLAHHANLMANLDDAVLGTDAEFVLTVWNRGAERMFGWTAAEALGHKVHELIPTSLSDEAMAAQLDHLVMTGRWRGAATFYGKDERAVEAEGLTVALQSDQGWVSGYVCILRDVAELRQPMKQLETTARQQALVAGLSLRALSSNHLRDLLDEALRDIAHLLQVELCAIAEIEPGGGGLSWRAAFGWTAEEIADPRLSTEDAGSLVGYTILVGEPVISEDVTADGRFRAVGLLAKRAPRSAAAVVIPGPRDPSGVLVVAAPEHRSFGSDEIEFMKAVATVVGVAVDRAGAEVKIEAAREAERSRIARDLHDEVLRELTEALAMATMARSRSGGPDEGRPWDALITALRKSAEQLRGAVYDLRLSIDDHRPFADLLSELVAIQAGLAPDCKVELHGHETLGELSLGDRGTELLRVVTEAITNSRRHSGATTIRVDASTSTDVLRLEISDDGAWPDREAALRSRPGAGIMGMLERADQLGAILRIDGRPEGGTRVSLTLALSVASSDG